MDYKGQMLEVLIKGFNLNAPAKSFLLETKGHNGYFSCTKCKVELFVKAIQVLIESRPKKIKNSPYVFAATDSSTYRGSDIIRASVDEAEGNFIELRMNFYEKNCAPRTHEEYLIRKDCDFQTGKSSLVDIPKIDFIKSFPLDYLHLICLGVVRTLLYLRLFASAPLKLPVNIVDRIKVNIQSLSAFIPCKYGCK